VGLELNGTHQLLTYGDDVNLLGDDIDIINKRTENLIDASKEVGSEVNSIYIAALFQEFWSISGHNICSKQLVKNVSSSNIWERHKGIKTLLEIKLRGK
jgi:hypothetical protein